MQRFWILCTAGLIGFALKDVAQWVGEQCFNEVPQSPDMITAGFCLCVGSFLLVALHYPGRVYRTPEHLQLPPSV